MPRALITGVTGQDGWYLSELLRASGFELYGLVLPGDASPLPDVIAPVYKAATSGGSTGRPKLIMSGAPGVVAGAGGAWIARRKQEARQAWPVIAYMGFLTALQMVAASMPPNADDPVKDGALALTVYLLVTGLAWLVDRDERGRAG